MIRLYKKGTMDFNTNGVGNLSDAVSCIVTEERNGQYELAMVYPITGIHFEEITGAAVILSPSGPGKADQAFDIYRITKPIDGKVTVHARHITYRASKIPVSPFSASGAGEALAGLKANAVEDCPFEFWTDKETKASFSVAEPASIRSRLGGNAGSILDVYGGEYEFDMYTIKLHSKRGTDSGVTLRYGNNITDFRQEESIAGTITGIYPFWKGQDDYLELPEKVIHSENYDHFPYALTIPVDFSFDFEEKPTEDQLRAAAERYVSQSHIGVPSISIKVAFAALWQTEEYKNIAPLLKVGLCDDVTVEFSELKISAKAEVVKTVYNVLLDRYDSIDLGDAQTDLADNIVSQNQAIAEKTSQSQVATQVKKATNLITGVNGGYVVLHQDANGKPFEILIMDTDSIETATNVWRWNKNGWGHSKTGYNGPYSMAATIDGGFVADYVTAGTLQGVKIIAESGTIGGWDISEKAIYKDVVDPNDPTIVNRVYFQPPLADGTKTWVLSCQKSVNSGNSFTGTFVLYSDGSAKFGDTKINADGSIVVGKTTINADGSAKFGNMSISVDGKITAGNTIITNNGEIHFGDLLKICSDGTFLWYDADGSYNETQITRQSDGSLVAFLNGLWLYESLVCKGKASFTGADGVEVIGPFKVQGKSTFSGNAEVNGELQVSRTLWNSRVKGVNSYTPVEVNTYYALYVYNYDGTAPQEVIASTYTTACSERWKENIEEADDVREIIKNSKIYKYNRKSDKENPKTEYGLILERECPEELMNSTKDGVDTFTMMAMLWHDHQRLIRENEDMEKRVAALEKAHCIGQEGE